MPGITIGASEARERLAVQDYLADLQAEADRLAPCLADRLTRLRALLTGEATNEKDNPA